MNKELFPKDPNGWSDAVIATPTALIDETTFQNLTENQKKTLHRTVWINGAMSLLRYFNDNKENDLSKIDLFLYGNKMFWKSARIDLERLFSAYEKDEKFPPTTSEEMIAYNFVRDVDEQDFQNLVEYKFNEAKPFKSIKKYCEQEIKKFELDWKDYNHFPIFKQWLDFLKGYESLSLEPDKPKKISQKQAILLLRELGFFDLPIFKNEFTIDVPTTKMGELLSYITNSGAKGCEDSYRLINGKGDPLATPDNIKVVNAIVSKLKGKNSNKKT